MLSALSASGCVVFRKDRFRLLVYGSKKTYGFRGARVGVCVNTMTPPVYVGGSVWRDDCDRKLTGFVVADASSRFIAARVMGSISITQTKPFPSTRCGWSGKACATFWGVRPTRWGALASSVVHLYDATSSAAN